MKTRQAEYRIDIARPAKGMASRETRSIIRQVVLTAAIVDIGVAFLTIRNDASPVSPVTIDNMAMSESVSPQEAQVTTRVP